jgi:Histidine kinase-like ATPase domain
MRTPNSAVGSGDARPSHDLGGGDLSGGDLGVNEACDPGVVGCSVLASMSEAASNCIEHAYAPATADGTVELTFWTEPPSLCIEIDDHGAWRKPSDTPTSRGRGIEIMRRLMAGVLIHFDGGGTRVFLSHLLSDEAVAPIATPALMMSAELPNPCSCDRTGPRRAVDMQTRRVLDADESPNRMSAVQRLARTCTLLM